MKTVFINGSPKKHFSASDYFLKLQSVFVKGQSVFLKVRNKSNHRQVLEQLADADAVVFSIKMWRAQQRRLGRHQQDRTNPK